MIEFTFNVRRSFRAEDVRVIARDVDEAEAKVKAVLKRTLLPASFDWSLEDWAEDAYLVNAHETTVPSPGAIE